MSKYEFTPEMNEISGFGGGYEAECRKMLRAGLEWLDAHPDSDPKFHGYEGLSGILLEDNKDAEALSEAVTSVAPGCTGAMHQAVITHCLFIRTNGWDRYVKEMTSSQEPE